MLIGIIQIPLHVTCGLAIEFSKRIAGSTLPTKYCPNQKAAFVTVKCVHNISMIGLCQMKVGQRKPISQSISPGTL